MNPSLACCLMIPLLRYLWMFLKHLPSQGSIGSILYSVSVLSILFPKSIPSPLKDSVTTDNSDITQSSGLISCQSCKATQYLSTVHAFLNGYRHLRLLLSKVTFCPPRR